MADDKFAWGNGELNIHASPRTLLVRDVLNPEDFGVAGSLYAVVAAIERQGDDLVLNTDPVEVPYTFERDVKDINGQPSLEFGSVDLEVRHAELEDIGAKPSPQDRPYIPHAPVYYGPIELGPERIF